MYTIVKDLIADYVHFHGDRPDYILKLIRKFLVEVETCSLTNHYPDAGDELLQRFEDESGFYEMKYLGQKLAQMPEWWQGSPERRQLVEKVIVLCLRLDEPQSWRLREFFYPEKQGEKGNAPLDYFEFVLGHWLLEKDRQPPATETVEVLYYLHYGFRNQVSAWIPPYVAALDRQKKRLAESWGIPLNLFDSAAEQTLNELIRAIGAEQERLRAENKWKEAQKYDAEPLPLFQDIVRGDVAQKVAVTTLLVFYRHFDHANLNNDVYKNVVKKLLSPDFPYFDLIRLVRLNNAPHADLLRILAQKQKKSLLPDELVSWLTQSAVMSKYQKILDVHFAQSGGSDTITPEKLGNSGFRSLVGGEEYSYAHVQTRARQLQEWIDDVLLLLSQVYAVQVLSVKLVPIRGNHTWETLVQFTYVFRLPDGSTRELTTTQDHFCSDINLILAKMNVAYRLSCQTVEMSKTRYRSERKMAGTHVRLVTTWMLREFPEVFPETPEELSFFQRSSRDQAPALLKSLAEIKKERQAAQKTGDPGDLLQDIRFQSFTETVIDKMEDADAVKPLAAHLLAYAGGAKPGEKWLSKLRAEQKSMGDDRYAKAVSYLLENVYRLELWYEESRLEAIKGMMWALSLVPQRHTFGLLRQVTEYAYAKVPGKGPRAAGLGEIGLKIFASSGSGEGYAQLSLMRAKCKYPRFKKQLDKAVQAFSAKAGLSEAELESMHVDDFGLQAGKLEQMIGDYAAIIAVENEKAHLQWLDPKGNEMKAAPSALKNSHTTELKAVQLLHKSLQQTLSAQRQRLEGGWLNNLSWTWAVWEPGFRSHALMRLLAEKIIWEFDLGTEKVIGLARAESLQRPDGTVEYPASDQIQSIRIWHPSTATVAEVEAWRDFLIRQQIRQPFKQAFREVYLLTEAELNTADYSNRFAGHILKTNNLLAIAPQRNWDFVYEHYDTAFPKRVIPAFGLRADYDLAQAPLGGVSPTGRVHFQRTGADTSWVPLTDVPPVVFSEIMRDVDLFVAITSIGSDPNWQSNGEAQQEYWRNYAYGSLSETQSAEERKRILAMMIPRTKLAKIARLEGNYVRVEGKFRAYKVNIGSGNILMEPNDQYLCIVPAPADTSSVDKKVWLPFEGDSLLTLILSKCFLLAEDDKIREGSILSQIKRT